jgi:hypothetical protein
MVPDVGEDRAQPRHLVVPGDHHVLADQIGAQRDGLLGAREDDAVWDGLAESVVQLLSDGDKAQHWRRHQMSTSWSRIFGRCVL